jgi:hypothetical protein
VAWPQRALSPKARIALPAHFSGQKLTFEDQLSEEKSDMKHILIGLAALTITTSAGLANDMIVAHPDSLRWGPAPPVLPKGAEISVIAGDPGKAGSYVIRVKVPANYQIPAHWHSTAENLTVVSGDVNVGMGDRLDKNHSNKLEVGGFIFLPSKMTHFLWTIGPAIFQIHAEGPFDIVYVNPKDDPSK